MICATTCLLPYGPQAYQIPLLRYMIGLGIFPRLKLTGYLLSQCANSSRVHPDIVLSTTLEEEKSGTTLRIKEMNGKEKEVCTVRVRRNSHVTRVFMLD